jgi:hypothetical protein
MSMIAFVANYQDLSTDKGYQFKFLCDKCGNGFLSGYEVNTLGTTAGLIQAAGSIFGGVLGSVGQSAYQVQRAIGGPAHDAALKKAIEEGKQHFHQCKRCGQWVCPEVCWNAEIGLCHACAPDAQIEMAAQQALATSEQIQTKTHEQDFTAKMDFKTVHSVATTACAKCGAELAQGAKFCGECGTAVAAAPKPFCAGCGAELHGAKFCPQCGQPANT